jgi:hypothetical protein
MEVETNNSSSGSRGTWVELKCIGEMMTSVGERVAQAIELDNDQESVERDCARVEQWLARVNPQLCVYENRHFVDHNKFILPKIALQYREAIAVALQRNESETQFVLDELMTELPVLDNPDWDPTIRPRQRTLCITRLALQRYKRPSALRITLVPLAAIVALYLCWLIYKIVLPSQ